MHQMTGVESIVIDSAPGWVHPSWAKCRLWDVVPKDVTDVLYFDADILPMKPWNPLNYAGRDFFYGCRDGGGIDVDNECATHELCRDQYLNMGLFIAPRSMRNLMGMAETYHPKLGRWLEQTALNKCLQAFCAQLTVEHNTLLWPGQDDYSPEALRGRSEINLHAASLGGDWRTLSRIQDAAGIP